MDLGSWKKSGQGRRGGWRKGKGKGGEGLRLGLGLSMLGIRSEVMDKGSCGCFQKVSFPSKGGGKLYFFVGNTEALPLWRRK